MHVRSLRLFRKYHQVCLKRSVDILAKERDYPKPAVSARRQIEARCASCWTTAQHQRHSVARALQPEWYFSCLHSSQSESARRHARMHSQTIRQASARAKQTKLRNTKNKHRHKWKHNNLRISRHIDMTWNLGKKDRCAYSRVQCHRPYQ